MGEILNNLVVNFNGHYDIKETFESIGLIFDSCDDHNYKVNQESSVDFTTVYMFVNELQRMDGFIFSKTNNVYHIYIT